MRDLPRLIHQGADDFERSLLTAGAREAASEQALARTLAAVGIGTAAMASSASASAALSRVSSAGLEAAGTKMAGTAAVGGAAFGKWALIGALGLAAAAGVGVYTSNKQSAVTVSELKVTSAPEPASMPAEVTAPSPAAPTEIVPIEKLAQAEDVAAEPVAAQNRKKPAASLTDEIQAVSEIKDSLSKPAAALQAINRYQQRFPRGRLQQEVTVLKIIALDRSGQRTQAKALGERFLAAHPKSAHAKRIRSVLGMQ